MDIATISEPVNKVYQSLEKGTFFKLIIGASYTHIKSIEDFVTVYALAGVDLIDVAADLDVISAAQVGKIQAKKIYEQYPNLFLGYSEPVIMASINVGDEPHFQKAVLIQENCTVCKHCIPVCSTQAFTLQGNILSYNSDLCYGCGKCLPVCQDNALHSIRRNVPLYQLEQIFTPLGVQAIEVHTGQASLEEVQNLCAMLPKEFMTHAIVSFSVESKRFNYQDLVNYTDNLTRIFSKKVIIQIDGVPMSGNSSAKSTLNTISAAGILLENNINGYIQLSGGTNHLTKLMAEQFKLQINGIGMGTFARKVVQPFLNQLSDIDILYQAVTNAKKLIDGHYTPGAKNVY